MVSTSSPAKYVQIITNDNSGCSFVRLRWNALYLQQFTSTNIFPVVVPNAIFDNNYLILTRCIIMQRPVDDRKMEQFYNLKTLQPKYGYKLVAEFDDMVWDSIPEYNGSSAHMNIQKNCENMKKICAWADEIMVSTEYMKKSIEKKFDTYNVTVVENAIPKYLWQNHRKPISEKIVKPKILYTGAAQHYMNPLPISQQFPTGIPGIKGDWTDKWIDFIIDNVKNDRIEFVCMTSLPFFFEEIKEKIQIIPWTDCNTFPMTVQKQNPDFIIAPLIDNEFNRCKSNLKLLESAAIGAVFIGDKFENGPYSNIITDIENFWSYTEPNKYNSIIDWQDIYMQQHGGYIESEKHLNKLISIMEK